jgi:hypothetical protein
VAVVADGTVREQGDGRRVRELLGRDGAAVPAEGAGGR